MADSRADGVEETLAGGGTTEVVRIGETVRRPRKPWSPAVHALLRHLRAAGFPEAPATLGVDEQGRDVFGYVPGEVGHYPWSEAVASDAALVSAASLLRRYHDAVAPAVRELGSGWQLPPIEPVEVVCHNDFAPYNCVYEGTRVVGLIDFDFAVAGPRRWDLGYALYRFTPLARDDAPDAARAQGRRARLFLDTYGIAGPDAVAALDTVTPRLQTLVDFMRSAAAAGDENFARHIAEGHLDIYLRDLAWIADHRPQWATQLTDRTDTPG
jgi:Ser/Thr protein kinase RdoA (MazF antagonist)